MAAIQPQQPTARQRLGEAIQKNLAAQRRNDRDVGDRCGCSPSDVARFRAGTLVPEQRVWRRMCEMVAKALFSYQSVYRDAMAEQEAEKELMLRGLRSHQVRSAAMPATPDQPAATVTALAPVQPDPEPTAEGEDRRAKDGRRMYPSRPLGSMSTQQVELRRNYVRKVLRTRPHRKSEGPDGVVTEVREVFGVGISPAEVEAIRREVAREFDRQAELPEQHATNPPGPIATAPDTQAPVPLPREAEITAAVAIVVETVPGLRSMTIEVDPATGDATYRYEVQAVTTGGGSVTAVRR